MRTKISTPEILLDTRVSSIRLPTQAVMYPRKSLRQRGHTSHDLCAYTDYALEQASLSLSPSKAVYLLLVEEMEARNFLV
jgi:hypothetical protein